MSADDTLFSQQFPKGAERAPGNTLPKKLAKIRQELKYTEKRGFNTFHKYDYVMAEDIAADLGKTLADAGIIITRDDLNVQYAELKNAKGETEIEARLTCIYVLRDSESGDYLRYASAGCGRDKGDKAIYKAFTGAFKYFFIQAFAMPLGEDPEKDERREREQEPEAPVGPLSDEQSKEIVKLIAQTNSDVKKMLDYYKVSDIKSLPYDRVKKALGSKLRRVKPADINEAASYPAVPPEAETK